MVNMVEPRGHISATIVLLSLQSSCYQTPVTIPYSAYIGWNEYRLQLPNYSNSQSIAAPPRRKIPGMAFGAKPFSDIYDPS